MYFDTLGLVADVELDDEELLVETLRTFMVVTSSGKDHESYTRFGMEWDQILLNHPELKCLDLPGLAMSPMTS